MRSVRRCDSSPGSTPTVACPSRDSLTAVRRVRCTCRTHDWGTDALGRSTHERVVEVKKLLDECGLRCWLDEEQMKGDINEAMAKGIAQMHPLGRLGVADDFSALAEVLLDNKLGGWITGSVLPVDGGRASVSQETYHRAPCRVVLRVTQAPRRLPGLGLPLPMFVALRVRGPWPGWSPGWSAGQAPPRAQSGERFSAK